MSSKSLFIAVIIFICSLSSANQITDTFSIVLSSGRTIPLYTSGNGDENIIIISDFRKNNIESAGKAVLTQISSGKIKIPSNKKIFIINNIFPHSTKNSYPISDRGTNILLNFPSKDWKKELFLYSKKYLCGNKPLDEEESKILADFIAKFDPHKTVVIVIDYDTANFIKVQNFSYDMLKFAQHLNKNTGLKLLPTLMVTGSFGNYLFEQYKIPSVFVGIKDINTEAIDKILNCTLNSDISKMLKNSNDSTDKTTYKELLLNTLPENIKIQDSYIDDFIGRFEKIKDDKELLLLVNKENYLDNNYIPKDITDVTGLFETNKNEIYLRNIIIDDLKEMFNSAKNDSINLSIVSAYRSYVTQKTVFQKWVNAFGLKEASRISAKPGSSQHQLGTAIDFNMLDEKFETTAAGNWLKKNSYNYGFIMSYPPEMEYFTGYRYEPWHYRYIGKDAAYIVNKYFKNNLELFLRWYWSLTDY